MTGQTLSYEHLGGDRHRHDGHGHSHGLVDESIRR